MELQRTLELAGRGVGNWMQKRPFCVSFEVTYSCNARCRHCHLGGHIDETLAEPQRYGEVCRELRPVVAQVSGGEPLLRKDLEQIIRALRPGRGGPFVVLTTNAVKLTRERFFSLLESGVDAYSVSLDYPDERHDEFRRVPGLFGRIASLIQGLTEEQRRAIAVSCVVQRDNYRDLLKLAELAKSWGVKLNFSTYTWMRTEDRGYMLEAQDLPGLRDMAERLMKFRDQYGTIVATPYVFDRMIDYFQRGSLGNCKACERFLIVNPDGTLSPCGLIQTGHATVGELRRDFQSSRNACADCNTSIRANSEKPLWTMVRDALRMI